MKVSQNATDFVADPPSQVQDRNPMLPWNVVAPLPVAPRNIRPSPCVEEVDNRVNYRFVLGISLWETWVLAADNFDPNGNPI
jgi:hypothetical protein